MEPKLVGLTDKGQHVVISNETTEREPVAVEAAELTGRVELLKPRITDLESNLKQLRRHVTDR